MKRRQRDLHKHKILEDGKVENTFCPYNTHNSYGFIDRDGYFRCNSSYCGDLKPPSLHTEFIDCIEDLIDDGYWNNDNYKDNFSENPYAWEFERDFDYVEETTWLKAYDLLKEHKCQLTEKTHKLAAEKLRAAADDEQPPQSKVAKVEN